MSWAERYSPDGCRAQFPLLANPGPSGGCQGMTGSGWFTPKKTRGVNIKITPYRLQRNGATEA